MSDSPPPQNSPFSKPGGVGRPRPTSDPSQSPALPQRDHLRRLANVFAGNPIYFLTCCTAQRRPILTSEKAAPIITEALRNGSKFHGWVVGRYVIMPDHVHFFARPHPDAKTLDAFLRDWKKWTAREINRVGEIGSPIWQPEFFDHVLRSANSYSEKWDYVRNNPVRAGLVVTAEAWPYSGEFEPLSF